MSYNNIVLFLSICILGVIPFVYSANLNCPNSTTALDFRVKNGPDSLMCVDSSGVLKISGDVQANGVSLVQLYNYVQNIPSGSMERHIFTESTTWQTPSYTTLLLVKMYGPGGFASSFVDCASTTYSAGSGAYVEFSLNLSGSVYVTILIGKSLNQTSQSPASMFKIGVISVIAQGGYSNTCTGSCEALVDSNIPTMISFNGTDPTQCGCSNIYCGMSKGAYGGGPGAAYGSGGYANGNIPYLMQGSNGMIMIEVY